MNSESFQKGNVMATWKGNLQALNPGQTFEVNVKSSVLGLRGCWATAAAGHDLVANRPQRTDQPLDAVQGQVRFQTKADAQQ